MRSAVQKTLLTSLVSMLRPIVRLTLKCGLSSQEFNEVARSLFISVASEDYGIRGRPTNISRVAAMTGISRKEVRKIRERDRVSQWTPEMEASPASMVLHHWHYDVEFSLSSGRPKALPLNGDGSFSDLVRSCAGDIPVSAMKAELERAGVIAEDARGRIIATKRYPYPTEFDEDFVRTVAFSIQNLATTIVHNADLLQTENYSEEVNEKRGHFERFAWTNHISADTENAFRAWVRKEGEKFVERADDWLGEKELPRSEWVSQAPRTVGVGVYYFREDS